MGKPYVRVVVDLSTGRAIDGTLDDQPFRPVEPSAAGQWLIVHDTKGRVVVRAFGPIVVGAAKWYGDAAQQREGLEDWTLVEATLRPLLAAAPRAPKDGLDRGVAPWIDDEPVARRPAANPRPYVRVIVDTVAGHVVDGTASISALAPIAPAQPHHWLVVHDTRGRIVVRAAHPSGPLVIGVGAWRDDHVSETHGLTATLPNAAQWELVASALRPLLDAARAQPALTADPDAPPWVDMEPMRPDHTPPAPVPRPPGPPRRFRLLRNHWTLTTKWTIRDDAGNDMFVIHGEVVGQKRLIFEDMTGKRVGYIWSGGVGIAEPGVASSYSFFRGNDEVASISQDLGIARRYTVRAHDEWLHVEGALFTGDFTFTRHKRPIATVAYASLLTDRYVAEIADGEDILTMLALVLMAELLFASS